MGFNIESFFLFLVEDLEDLSIRLNDAGVDRLLKEVKFQQAYAKDCGIIETIKPNN